MSAPNSNTSIHCL